MKPKSIKFVRMTTHEANQHLLLQLKKIYDAGEAMHIADMVMEHVTGKNRVERRTAHHESLSEHQNETFEKYSAELLTEKPVQYILHEAWFAGMKLYVDENVLIPRPETEELVEWVAEKTGKLNSTILDVGTGSGCIAVALKKKLPYANVHGIDISDGALAVAQKNAKQNKAEISLLKMDILDEARWNELPRFDVIVSNPPYVPEKEKESMHNNVVKFEPHSALFVPDNDPFLFYKKIARFAEEKLNEGGEVFFEIHQNYGEELRKVFERSASSKSEIKKDLNGNNRFFRLLKG